MIRLMGVHFGYRRGEAILAGVDLEIGSGLTLLVGPNGSGKSTLLKLLAGVERPDAGTVEVNGHDLWRGEVAARASLAFVPEHPDLTPYASVAEILALVARLRRAPLDSVQTALERAGIEDFAERSVRELSMGQRRRAVLAAAFIATPATVLLDEPLEAMDRSIRTAVTTWLDGLLAAGHQVVVATHQIEPFLGQARSAVTLRAGRAVTLSPLPADRDERTRAVADLAT
jgi:ABC-type multidrug transport system ATPase subunit